jgi:hypothetical protein
VASELRSVNSQIDYLLKEAARRSGRLKERKIEDRNPRQR